MVIKWGDIALGEFVLHQSLYVLKVHSLVGVATEEKLHADSNVRVARHVTARGRIIGYSVELRKKGTRTFKDKTYLMLFTGPRPAEHTFLSNIISEQLFTAAVYKAGSRHDYMFLNRMREEEPEEEESE